jgi:hypothetical protein
MNFEEIEAKLILGKRMLQPVTTHSGLDKERGYYSIWITDINKLPVIYQDELKKRNTKLLYIGIAEITLLQRLFLQDLQHKNPATFFRSIGAVSGYRPESGSLFGKVNQTNYYFSKKDTSEIISWNDTNLEISFCCVKQIKRRDETTLIKKYTPILNWTHNPTKFQPLKIVKDECRKVARKSLD